MSGDHDKYHGTAEVVKDGGVYLSREEAQELLDALEEALYLLDPTEKDIEKKAGMYRVMTARWKLKEKNRPAAPKREWVYLTEEEMLHIVTRDGMQLAEAIEAKLKQKNT